MNNPASKEPSMDEILSSIRQIIADEDQPAEQGIAEEGAAKPAATAAVDEPTSEADADQAMMAAQVAAPEILDVPDPVEDAKTAGDEDGEALALTPDQMIEQSVDAGDITSDEDELGVSFPSPSSDPEQQLDDTSAQIGAEPEAEIAEFEAPAESDEEIEMVIADDIAFDEPEGEIEEPTVAEPMPDTELSTQMADKLLEPTTDAAVRHTFSKLNALAIGGADLTLEGMVRDMLRPMLKEWLDENLPATVERMVEKEIERVSRGS